MFLKFRVTDYRFWYFKAGGLSGNMKSGTCDKIKNIPEDARLISI